jgi:hypothetical protein
VAATPSAPEHRLPAGGRTQPLVATVLGLAFLVGVWSTWAFIVDDAYITYRYSRHLAEGYGPVWNIGEDPVEGFTNFAWMLWHAPFAAVGTPLAVVSKATSSLCGGLTLWLLLRGDGTEGWRLGGPVAAAAFALFLPTYFHVTAGLETVAFAAVLLRGVLIGLRAQRGEAIRSWEPVALLLLAGMLRPEGALAALPMFVWWLLRRRADRSAWAWSAVGLLVGTGYFLARWAYFGQLFPNTFYVKFGNVSAGSSWMLATLWTVAPLLLLSSTLLLKARSRPAGIIILGTTLLTYAPYAASGPSMDYLHRFAFHAFPVLCLGAGLAVSAWRRPRTGALTGLLAVVWVAVMGATSQDLPVIANYGTDLQRAHVAIGRGLARADVPVDARTVAVSDAGAIPYFSGWTTTDYMGLNDESIAHGADVTATVEAAQPTVIVVSSHTPRAPLRLDKLIVHQVTDGYVQVASVQMRADYWQVVFASPQWADRIRGPVRRSVASAQRQHDPGRYDLTVDRWLDRLQERLPG